MEDFVGSAPVVILSVARSGTTLLASLLNQHPRIGILGSSVLAMVMQRHAAIISANTEETRQARDYAELRMAFLQFYGEQLSGRDGHDYDLSGKRRMDIWGFKALNVVQRHHFELLRAVFPDARFLHLVRDGRAVVASWLDNWRTASGQPTKRRDPLFAARTWSLSTGLARELLPHAHVIRIEDLQERSTRHSEVSALLKRLNVEPHPAVGRFVEDLPLINATGATPRSGRTALDPEALRRVLEVKGFEESLRRFGYEPQL